MLTAKNITICAENRIIIEDFSYQFKNSAMYNVMGPSGCGKSTLLRSLLGLKKPSKGEVITEDGNIYQNPQSLERHWSSAFIVPQKPTFIGDTIRDNLSCFLQSDQVSDDILNFLISEFKIDINYTLSSKVSAEMFSGGELQRMAIIRAILKKPKKLFLDEATSALDKDLSNLSFRLILDLLPSTMIFTVNHRTPEGVEFITLSF